MTWAPRDKSGWNSGRRGNRTFDESRHRHPLLSRHVGKVSVPHTLLEDFAKTIRIAKLRTLDEARSAAFMALVRDAVRLDASEPAHSH